MNFLKNLPGKIKASDNGVIVISIVVGGILVKLLGLSLPEETIKSISEFIIEIM